MSGRLPRPRRLRDWIIVALAVIVPLGAIAFALTYFVLLGGSSAPALGTTQKAKLSPSIATASIPGTWTIAAGSVAGYRVREKLAFLSAQSDAVGRTSHIAGTATITGSGGALAVSAAHFVVQVNTLTSDQQMRDDHIHTIGLESDTYPTATFVLDAPVTLPATVTSGATVSVAASGMLTIHGSTQAVTIPLKADLSGAQIEVSGSITFPFEKFGMQVPNVLGFVSVVDSATMEFDILLQHA